MHLYVCSLSKLERTVSSIDPGRLVSLVRLVPEVPSPPSLAPEHHLRLPFHDINEPRDGYVMPGEEHVERLLAFADGWDRAKPMLLHCYAGISRSTAAAYVVACALQPSRSEDEIANELRFASPTATPNSRLVAIADHVLKRQGRMSAAIAEIGRGAEAAEGTPFRLVLKDGT